MTAVHKDRPCHRYVGRPAAFLLLLTVLSGSSGGTLAQTPPPVAAPAAAPAGELSGVIESNPHGASTLRLNLRLPLGPTILRLTDPNAAALLAHSRIGDVVSFATDDVAHPSLIKTLVSVQRPTWPWERLIALALGALLVIFFASLATWWRPTAFFVGIDGRLSNSQTQLALWFGALATIYAATLGLRIYELGGAFIGGIDIPKDLLGLTGLSALTFGGARAITVAKVDAAAANAAQATSAVASTTSTPNPTPSMTRTLIPIKTTAAKAQLRDLVTNDAGRADLGDFQMIMITLVAITVFAMRIYHYLGALPVAETTTLPDVDTTLLAAFGLGQGAYLGKKAASNLGD